MRFSSGKDFRDWPQKAVTIFGMSGVGKTTLAQLLQDSGWFHYSVDYRIGTRYMGEHIVDNFKREAMRVPFLRDLLLSDSIHIKSNITFDHLKPLSTYLGKPGNPAKGGISFAEYKTPPAPASRGRDLAPCSMCRPSSASPATSINMAISSAIPAAACAKWSIPSNRARSGAVLPRRRTACCSISRARPNTPACWWSASASTPSPCTTSRSSSRQKWAEYKALNAITNDDDVDPDGFAVWGFEQLLHHRIPLYKAIADQFRLHGPNA